MLRIATVLLLFAGCSSRTEEPVILEDSTIIYSAKKENDVEALITLCRKEDKKTGDRMGEGNAFTIMEGEDILALVEIQNRFIKGNRELMFHLDWIGPDSESFFRKQIDLLPTDSSTTISSSISISPGRREAGKYKLRIYFFRELIAEKNFEIFPEYLTVSGDNEKIQANITLYRKTSKQTGKLIGEGNIFEISKKENVRARVELENRFVLNNRELIFFIDWYGPDGASFYSKEINLLPGDSTSVLSSSISISPGKREPGEYALRILLFDKLIAEKKFELQKE